MNIKCLEARIIQSLIAFLMLIYGSHGKAQSYCNPNLDYLRVWNCKERTATFDAEAYQNVSKDIISWHHLIKIFIAFFGKNDYVFIQPYQTGEL